MATAKQARKPASPETDFEWGQSIKGDREKDICLQSLDDILTKRKEHHCATSGQAELHLACRRLLAQGKHYLRVSVIDCALKVTGAGEKKWLYRFKVAGEEKFPIETLCTEVFQEASKTTTKVASAMPTAA